MSTERSIPHLRDVFGLGGYQTPYQHHAYPMSGSQQHRHIDPYNQSQQPPSRLTHHQMPPSHQTHYNPDNSPVPFPTQSMYPPQYQPPPNAYQQPPATVAPYSSDVLATKSASTRKRRDNYKTLTSGDVKTLERHLSMKKTIRKKIMRDLQQAFVDDPNEFKVEHNNSDRLKSELNMEALRFGDSGAGNASDNFLVMLRDDQLHHHRPGVGGGGGDDYSGYRGGAGSSMMTPATREYDYDSAATVAKNREEKPSFWKRFTFKNKQKT